METMRNDFATDMPRARSGRDLYVPRADTTNPDEPQHSQHRTRLQDESAKEA